MCIRDRASGNTLLDPLNVASDPVQCAHCKLIIYACADWHLYLASYNSKEGLEQFACRGQDTGRRLIGLLLLDQIRRLGIQIDAGIC